MHAQSSQSQEPNTLLKRLLGNEWEGALTWALYRSLGYGHIRQGLEASYQRLSLILSTHIGLSPAAPGSALGYCLLGTFSTYGSQRHPHSIIDRNNQAQKGFKQEMERRMQSRISFSEPGRGPYSISKRKGCSRLIEALAPTSLITRKEENNGEEFQDSKEV